MLDLTLEVAELEKQERQAHGVWQAAKAKKDAKFAKLLALTRGQRTGNGITKPPVKTSASRPQNQAASVPGAPAKQGAKARVLEFLNSNRGKDFTTLQIAKAIGAPGGSTSMYLTELVRANAVTRVDIGKYRAKGGETP